MEYKGKLYGKMGNTYFPLLHTTDDWEQLENKVEELESVVNKNCTIVGVSVSLPTDEEITDWVCNEFRIDGLDFDEDVNTQNGYLPEHFKSFAKWILSNER